VTYSSGDAQSYFMSSGSCCSFSSWGSTEADIVFHETRYTWVCHYCGSTVDEKDLKCPQCAGEKRVRVVSNTTSHVNIKYCEDDPVYDIRQSVDRESCWTRMRNWMKGSKK